MEMTMLAIVAVLLIAWLILRRRANQRQAQRAIVPPKKEDTTYHAVSIKLTKTACAAARALSGQRFLATEAPRLPLPECNVARCECRFAHYKDRRSGHDRRSPFGKGAIGGGTGRYDKERRERPDRRRSADTSPF